MDLQWGTLLVQPGEKGIECPARPPLGKECPSPTTHRDKHSVLFLRNTSQNMQLEKYFFLPRFFLTERGMHHILYSSRNQTTR